MVVNRVCVFDFVVFSNFFFFLFLCRKTLVSLCALYFNPNTYFLSWFVLCFVVLKVVLFFFFLFFRKTLELHRNGKGQRQVRAPHHDFEQGFTITGNK